MQIVGIGQSCVAYKIVDTPVAEEFVNNLGIAHFVVGVCGGFTLVNSIVGVYLQSREFDAHHYCGTHRIPLDAAFSFPAILAVGRYFIYRHLVLANGNYLVLEFVGRCLQGLFVGYFDLARTLEIFLAELLDNGKIDNILVG